MITASWPQKIWGQVLPMCLNSILLGQYNSTALGSHKTDQMMPFL